MSLASSSGDCAPTVSSVDCAINVASVRPLLRAVAVSPVEKPRSSGSNNSAAIVVATRTSIRVKPLSSVRRCIGSLRDEDASRQPIDEHLAARLAGGEQHAAAGRTAVGKELDPSLVGVV